MDKLDTLDDVALETINTLGQKRLLLLGDALQGVNGLLGTVGLYTVSQMHISTKTHLQVSTYAKLNGNGEEVGACLLGDGLTTRDTGQVDVAGLDKTLLALGRTEDLLSESGHGMSVIAG